MQWKKGWVELDHALRGSSQALNFMPAMSIKHYLDRFRGQKILTLTGPFCAPSTTLGEPVIFVDRGARYRKSGQGIAVGDGDSFDGELDVLLDRDKDFSDLAFALANIPQGFSEIHLLGFLGGRRDHELFNFGEVHRFLSTAAPTQARFDDKVIACSAGRWSFCRHGGFSIGVLEESRVRMEGACRYPCSEPTLFKPLTSLGLSNIGSGTIWLECSRPVFVFFEEPD